MDFIRHSNSNQTKSSAVADLADQSPSKDNLLQGNLNYTHISTHSPLVKKKIIIPDNADHSHTKSASLTYNMALDNGIMSNSLLAHPQKTSTIKGQQQPQVNCKSNQEQLRSTPHHTLTESLSSSFESEALDILASLKSSAALRHQYNKHAKFPTDVDPVTGSPRRQHVPSTPNDPSIPSSHRSSRVNSPSINSNSSVVGSRSHSQTRSPQVNISPDHDYTM